MRVRSRLVGGLMMAALFGVGSAGAEELKWLGVHGAYYSQFEKGAVGINARQDVGNDVSVGFLTDYVFRATRTTWVFSADLQLEKSLLKEKLALWAGGGGGVLRDDQRGPNLKPQYELFAVGFVGAGADGKPIMPYVEMRFMSHQKFHGVLYAGIRF